MSDPFESLTPSMAKAAYERAILSLEICGETISALRERERRLVEALKPFAGYSGSDEYLKSAPDHGLCSGASFKAGDYRRARAILKELEGEKG